MMQVELINDGPVTFWLAGKARGATMRLVEQIRLSTAARFRRIRFAVFDPGNTLSAPIAIRIWRGSEAPAATGSFALDLSRPRCAIRGDDVNQEPEISSHSAAVDFFHWSLIDIAPAINAIEAAAFHMRMTRAKRARGCQRHAQGIMTTPAGSRSTTDMEGDYYGYDGPPSVETIQIVHH